MKHEHSEDACVPQTNPSSLLQGSPLRSKMSRRECFAVMKELTANEATVTSIERAIKIVH